MPYKNKTPEEMRAIWRKDAKAWRARDPERARKANRASMQKVYENRRTAFAGRPRPLACECCGDLGGETKGTKLVTDHDHGTGEFRGWICPSCNTALGMIRDDPQRAMNLIEYLRASFLAKNAS